MKFLKKLKSSNFWVSMIDAVVLILQAVFNVEIKTEYLNQIIMAILGLLVMSGIVSDNSTGEVTVKQNVNIDSLKENIISTLTQTTSSIENIFLNIVNKLESMKNNDNQATVNLEESITQNQIEEKAISQINEDITDTLLQNQDENVNNENNLVAQIENTNIALNDVDNQNENLTPQNGSYENVL